LSIVVLQKNGIIETFYLVRTRGPQVDGELHFIGGFFKFFQFHFSKCYVLYILI